MRFPWVWSRASAKAVQAAFSYGRDNRYTVSSTTEKHTMVMWNVGKLALASTLLALLAGCTSTPTADQGVVVSGRWEVRMTDSCAKLAGFLVLADLFDMKAPPGEPDFRVEARAEMDRRCADDVRPEAPEVAFSIPTAACADLRGFVAMAGAFGMMATLPREARDIADKLLDDMDAEIERRCPPLE